MNNLDKEFNTLIMQEIGLEIGDDDRIYDQETQNIIRMNGMDVMAPGCYGGRNSIEFDPYNNKKMMSQLFGYFIDKYSEETGIGISSYYDINDNNCLECRMDDNSKLRSNSFKRDSLKYADLIIKLNGGGEVNLDKYDQEIKQQTVKRSTRQRKVDNDVNSINTETTENC